MIKKYLIAVIIVLLFFSYSIAVADETQFTLGTGDVIEISVWKDESLSRKVVVPPDGIISFPLAGDINTKDMNVTELRKVITQKLTEYVPDATVTVMIQEINSLRAYVIGKVNNPGEFAITMNTSVMQVLAMARGLNPFASAGKIHILRHKKNVTVKIPFNYKQVEKGENLKQNIVLQRGDVVVVP